MKQLVAGVLLLVMVGCSPTLIVRPDGSIEAKNYAIVQKGDTKVYTPKPWWHLSFVDSILKALGSVVPK